MLKDVPYHHEFIAQTKLTVLEQAVQCLNAICGERMVEIQAEINICGAVRVLNNPAAAMLWQMKKGYTG